MILWTAKSPQSEADYIWNVTLDADDVIQTLDSVVVANGSIEIMALPAPAKTDAAVTVWLAGGADGETCMGTISITTAGGRKFREVFVVPVFDAAELTLAEFRLRFDEFETVEDAVVGRFLALSRNVFGADYGDVRTEGVLLLTAHELAMRGLGTSADSQRQGKFAGATRVKSGSLELSWDSGSKAGSSAGGGYSATRFGQAALALAKAHKGGPRVTGTGTFPPRVNYGNA